MIANENQQLGRAKNAVLSFLENRLIIPKIYLNAEWGGQRLDVLAIERDGVGDVHAVLMFLPEEDEAGNLNEAAYKRDVSRLIDQFSDVAAHYKYIAIANRFIQISGNYIIPPERSRRDLARLRQTFFSFENSFSPDGLGRIGLLSSEPSDNGEIEVKLEIKPERFRAKIAKLADEYVQQHEADWEIRA